MVPKVTQNRLGCAKVWSGLYCLFDGVAHQVQGWSDCRWIGQFL